MSRSRLRVLALMAAYVASELSMDNPVPPPSLEPLKEHQDSGFLGSKMSSRWLPAEWKSPRRATEKLEP